MKNSNLLEPLPQPASTNRAQGGNDSSASMPLSPEMPASDRERETESVIDTSKMSQAQREALELTEAARTVTKYRSFAGDLFMGRFALDHVYPFPMQAAADVEEDFFRFDFFTSNHDFRRRDKPRMAFEHLGVLQAAHPLVEAFDRVGDDRVFAGLHLFHVQ